jgi:hypothetical protein
MGDDVPHIQIAAKWLNGWRCDGRRICLIGAISALVLLCPSLACSAHAMSIDAKALKAWRINDMTNVPPTLRIFIHGAIATIVPKEGEAIPTIFVFKHQYMDVKIGTSIHAWEKYVDSIETIRKYVLRHERAYEVDGGARFYTDLVEGHGDETLYSAVLFIVSRSRRQMMMFEFSGPKRYFMENIKTVMDLYHRIKIVE